MPSRAKRARPLGAGAIRVAVVGTLFMVVFVLSILRAFDWDASAFLHVGEDSREILSYVEDRLGEVPTFGGLGHDGKYFFIQAHDPLLLDPEVHAAVIDRSAYRYQRVLYPVLAAPGLIAGEGGLVWWLLFINIGSVGLGTWVTARLAEAGGGSPWWGLAFALNPGVIFEVVVDGAGVVALALGLVALLKIVRKQWWAAALAFALSGLAREVMVVMALGSALYVWKHERSNAVKLGAIPIGVVAAWGIYVRMRLEVGLAEAQSVEIGLPFAGLISAATKWMKEPGYDLAVGLLLVAVCILVTRRLAMERTLITLSIAGFVILAIVLTDRVWLQYFDITRALAPLISGFALIVALDGRPQGLSWPRL